MLEHFQLKHNQNYIDQLYLMHTKSNNFSYPFHNEFVFYFSPMYLILDTVELQSTFSHYSFGLQKPYNLAFHPM